MGSKSHNNSHNFDEDMSNGESSKGNDTSLIVNVNDTQSDIDEHEESNYSQTDNHVSSKKVSPNKRSRNDESSKKRFVAPMCFCFAHQCAHQLTMFLSLFPTKYSQKKQSPQRL